MVAPLRGSVEFLPRLGRGRRAPGHAARHRTELVQVLVVADRPREVGGRVPEVSNQAARGELHFPAG